MVLVLNYNLFASFKFVIKMGKCSEKMFELSKKYDVRDIFVFHTNKSEPETSFGGGFFSENLQARTRFSDYAFWVQSVVETMVPLSLEQAKGSGGF